MRAAQYVRMSTEHQQYSIENQQAAIAQYAQERCIEIVKTYADPARSGLDLAHRPGLRKLLEDVVSANPGFEVVLVYDVSRWGRFQDVDESAYYEFLCKKARVRVHYCAEPFPNDDSPTSSLLKLVKRTMAAEYLRELSAKVHAGQCRVAANGFKLGGRAGYGLRRLLLDSEGKPKAVLQDGERKSLTTERVTYCLGPDEEVHNVRLIFALFLEEDKPVRSIARLLNDRGIRRGIFGPWDHNAVFRILTHPKYAGCAAFNRASEKLRSKKIRNPRDQWVLRPASFPAIVSQDTFDRTQAKLANLVNRRSNDRLLSELRAAAEAKAKLTPSSIGPRSGLASASTYVKRFGSLMWAYELVGYRPPRYTIASLEGRRTIASLRVGVTAEFERALLESCLCFARGENTFRVRGHGHVGLEVARSVRTPNGHLRWMVRTRKSGPKQVRVVARLQSGNTAVQDFVLLFAIPKGIARYFTLSDSMAREAGIVCQNLGEVIAALLNRTRRTSVA
jgi:DNA invertase Pin-like site-specific DNA recombinase